MALLMTEDVAGDVVESLLAESVAVDDVGEFTSGADDVVFALHFALGGLLNVALRFRRGRGNVIEDDIAELFVVAEGVDITIDGHGTEETTSAEAARRVALVAAVVVGWWWWWSARLLGWWWWWRAELLRWWRWARRWWWWCRAWWRRRRLAGLARLRWRADGLGWWWSASGLRVADWRRRRRRRSAATTRRWGRWGAAAATTAE